MMDTSSEVSDSLWDGMVPVSDPPTGPPRAGKSRMSLFFWPGLDALGSGGVRGYNPEMRVPPPPWLPHVDPVATIDSSMDETAIRWKKKYKGIAAANPPGLSVALNL